MVYRSEKQRLVDICFEIAHAIRFPSNREFDDFKTEEAEAFKTKESLMKWVA